MDEMASFEGDVWVLGRLGDTLGEYMLPGISPRDADESSVSSNRLTEYAG